MADYIKREDALTLINFENPAWEDYSAASHGYALECVRSCEAQDVAPVRHGRWMHEWYECSVCHESLRDIMDADSYFSIEFETPPYCCFCGAKMDGGADDATD